MKKKKNPKILGEKKKRGWYPGIPWPPRGFFSTSPPPIMHDNEFFSCLRPRIALFRLFLKVAYIICIPNVAYIFCRTGIPYLYYVTTICTENCTASIILPPLLLMAIDVILVLKPIRSQTQCNKIELFSGSCLWPVVWCTCMHGDSCKRTLER